MLRKGEDGSLLFWSRWNASLNDGWDNKLVAEILSLTVDDQVVNDAAYELSEQGLSLERAEESVREALTQFDPGESASAVSTSYADSSAERTSLLLATWDTLG